MKAAAGMSPHFVFKWRSGRILESGNALPDGEENGLEYVTMNDTDKGYE